MKKKITKQKKIHTLWLLNAISLPFLVWGFTSVAHAQSSSPAFPDKYIRQYERQHQRLLQLAKKKDWPLQLRQNTHRIFTLQRLDALGQPVYYGVHTSPLSAGTRTTALYEGGGLGLALSGSSPALRGKLAMWDGGKVRADHRELTGKITQTDIQMTSVTSDHATHMAGTMVGKGIYQQATGMAFGAGLQVWDFGNDLTEIARHAPSLLVSNHAYGPVAGWVLNPSRPGASNDDKWEWWGTPAVDAKTDYRFGFYEETVSETDRITYNFPYLLMVRSADNKRIENGPPAGTSYFLKNSNTKSTLPRDRNDGYDIIPGEANAKNVLTVGSADGGSITYAVAPYSGWGPTDDGRIKPDLLGIGSNVLSSVGTDTDAYGVLTGTSMASANVSGSLFLLQELYHQQKGRFMLASTLKALALHTATKPQNKITPDYTYGWGLLNAEKAAKVILNQEGKAVLSEKVLQQGETLTQRFIASGNEPLVVTICWTDPEATPIPVSSRNVNNRSPRLVNDLDMLMLEGFNSHQPWVLDPENPEKPAQPGNNFRDNIEQIYIPNPVKGRAYTLTITHKNTLKNNRQPFSLVATGTAKPDCELGAALTPGLDTTLCVGKTILLSANAGTDFQYEWFQNGSVIKKGTERFLEITRPGSYAVRVSGQGCTAISKSVTVRSSTLFSAIDKTGPLLVCDSKGVELASNTGNTYRYQWLRNGSPISGATNARFQAAESGTYQVQIRDQQCVATSPGTAVEVTPVEAYLTPSVSAPICNGQPAILKAPQKNGYSYRWYFNNSLLSGATQASYPAPQPGRYAVEVRHGACLVKSTDVVVQRVQVAAAITPPSNTLIPPGGSLALQANYEIGNRYKWYRNDSLILNETAPLLTVREGGTYRVSVENTGCLAESKPITLRGNIGNIPSNSSIPLQPLNLEDTLSILTVFPNPATETVAVALRIQGFIIDPTASILTLQGEVVRQQALRPERDYLKTIFDLRSLPAGMYLLKVRVGTRNYSKLFFKR
ncbi:S8 family serine peptidase [Arundinibacter roseus]|uniref:Peptidase S8/S53 domain-containing protein n=1 Tax=Arundinibacter roseus TaxID=2070510 RepID=A0A4R4K729_9BACT|nr:S8 family serine peptidase [Arundinibacter roseus]TDB63354.1 hypothetical protein EZE20_16410 [Arundinibacter roseus]